MKNIRDLIALAKAKPGQINYGSTGTGGHNHLATELFKAHGRHQHRARAVQGRRARTDRPDGRHTQLVMTSLPSAMTSVQAGRLKALAVGSEKRTSFMPEIPTIAESGVPGYMAEFWWGLAAPAKTPPDIINRLATELTKALQSPELKQRLPARLRAQRDVARSIHQVRRQRNRALAQSRAGLQHQA